MVSQSVLKEDIGVTFHNSKKDIEAITYECDLSINPDIIYSSIYQQQVITRINQIMIH